MTHLPTCRLWAHLVCVPADRTVKTFGSKVLLSQERSASCSSLRLSRPSSTRVKGRSSVTRPNNEHSSLDNSDSDCEGKTLTAFHSATLSARQSSNLTISCIQYGVKDLMNIWLIFSVYVPQISLFWGYRCWLTADTVSGGADVHFCYRMSDLQSRSALWHP